MSRGRLFIFCLAFFGVALGLAAAPSPCSAYILRLYSEPTRDGAVYDTSPRQVVNDATLAKVGEQFTNGSRTFLSFNIVEIPSTATVYSATLRVYQDSTSSSDPFTTGNSEVIAQHLTYGSSLDASDYDLAAINTNVGTLSDSGTSGWKELDVTEQVREDVANITRARSQYRLRLWPLDVVGDLNNSYFVFYQTGEATNPPELVINYDYNLLTVIKDGNATGLVTSDQPGINCGTDCSQPFLNGTQVILTATPLNSAVVFDGWNGTSNSSNSSILVTMNGDQNVTATFYLITPIPTLGEYGIALMGLLLAGSMVWLLRRRGAV